MKINGCLQTEGVYNRFFFIAEASDKEISVTKRCFIPHRTCDNKSRPDVKKIYDNMGCLITNDKKEKLITKNV